MRSPLMLGAAALLVVMLPTSSAGPIGSFDDSSCSSQKVAAVQITSLGLYGDVSTYETCAGAAVHLPGYCTDVVHGYEVDHIGVGGSNNCEVAAYWKPSPV